MFNVFEKKRQQRLNREMHQAISRQQWPKVEKLLRDGANPKTRGTPFERYLPLAEAVLTAPLSTINAFLDAGADPQEPYRWNAIDYPLSEIAEVVGRDSDIVERLKRAEVEAEAKNGPRALDRGGPRKSCGRRPPL